MEIQNRNSESRGVFTAVDEGKEAGKMTYALKEEQNLVIEHTEVDPTYQGKGVGKKLVDEAAGFARENNLKIAPECNYARKVLEKSDRYKDVLA